MYMLLSNVYVAVTVSVMRLYCPYCSMMGLYMLEAPLTFAELVLLPFKHFYIFFKTVLALHLLIFTLSRASEP